MSAKTAILPVFALVLASTGACGPGRTAAATQPTPAAFDPAQSDSQALAVIDKMTAALGGVEAWEEAKQISWEQKYYLDNKLTAWFRHYWDRWNGRHRFEIADMDSMAQAQAEGVLGKTRFTVAMYDLFDHGRRGTAYQGNDQLPAAERDRVVKTAAEAWASDSYRLTFHYKVRDPGVKLAHAGQVKSVSGHCEPACEVIKVTFDPGVGDDTYYISVNTQSHMPEILERVVPDGRIGFSLRDWAEVGGIKIPTKLTNLGMSEVFQIENLKVGQPDDALYIPQVR